MKKISTAIVLAVFTLGAIAQTSKSFELRYFSDDPKANGETDFKGETEVFDTEQRVEFLKHYADYAKKFFNDKNLDYMVVSDEEASQAASKIKPQPQPEYRNRIVLDEWKWRGYRSGIEMERKHDLMIYDGNDRVTVQEGVLLTKSERTAYTWKFPLQSWRSSITWRASVPATGSKVSFIFSELEKIPGAEVGFGADGKFYYTTANNETVVTEAYEPDRWYNFKIEFDLAATRRGRDMVRYNLYIDGKLVADYVTLQRVVSHEGVGWPSQSASIAGINRMTLWSGPGVKVDNIWGVGYHLTGRENFPYSVETFMDQDFESLPVNDGWQTFEYDDALWKSGILPISHGSERHAEEDLFLRKKVTIGEFAKAYLNIESLDPGGEVWVNGRVAAVITDRSQQQVDLSSFLTENSENIIGVIINHFYLDKLVGEIMHHSSLDFNIGWFAGKMSLDLLNLTSIQDAFVYTKSIEGRAAGMTAKVNIENKYWKAFRGTMEMKMQQWFPIESEQVSAEATVDLLLHHDVNEIEVPFEVDNAKLWSPEDPNLYKIQFILKDDQGNIIDDLVTTTGVCFSCSDLAPKKSDRGAYRWTRPGYAAIGPEPGAPARMWLDQRTTVVRHVEGY